MKIWHGEHARLVGMVAPLGKICSHLGDQWHFSPKDGDRSRVSSPWGQAASQHSLEWTWGTISLLAVLGPRCFLLFEWLHSNHNLYFQQWQDGSKWRRECLKCCFCLVVFFFSFWCCFPRVSAHSGGSRGFASRHAHGVKRDKKTFSFSLAEKY